MASSKRACARCGRIRSYDGRRTPNICQDCREADPDYVKAIKTGVRAA